MNPFEALILLIWVAAATVTATLTGRRKGRLWTGFFLGLFLGWIGVIIIAVIPPTHEALVARERKRQQVQREARGKPY